MAPARKKRGGKLIFLSTGAEVRLGCLLPSYAEPRVVVWAAIVFQDPSLDLF